MTDPVLSAAQAFLQRLDLSTTLDPAQAQAIDVASEPFAIGPEALAALPLARLLDVRRAALFAQAGNLIPGAHWCNPVHIGTAAAASALAPPADQALVVYCVHGHAVSRSAVLALRAQGHDARFLSGGIAAWVAAGRPVLATLHPSAGTPGAQP